MSIGYHERATTMTLGLLLFAGIFWFLPMYIAYEQGKAKNRLGLAWGLLLGWVGVLALAALPPAAQSKHKSFELTK
jgi:hypothetical protein